MGIESFRIDFFIYSCQSVDEVLLEIQKSYSLEKDYFNHFFKKHYIKNTFILNGLAKIYLNYEKQTDYVYMSFESCFSNYEKYIKLAYMLYEKLQITFPTRVKLKVFLNDLNQKISYKEFSETIKEFYKEQYNFYKMHYNVKGVDLLPGTQFYKKYKKFQRGRNNTGE